MTIYGISVDEPAASRSFAGDYEIRFPLLSDRDGSVSRAYVGLDAADVTVPGIVVIRRDGQIVFRQIATSKDDRLTAAQLVATLDRTLGTRGPAARTGYAVLERPQLTLAAGAGAIRVDGDWRATGAGLLSALVPVHRNVAIGGMLRTEPREGPFDAAAVVALRRPILAETGAVQLSLAAGYAPAGSDGMTGLARLGVWVALSPDWALHVEAGAGAHRLTGDPVPDVIGWFGVSRMIRR